jgi:hypothetical protein
MKLISLNPNPDLTEVRRAKIALKKKKIRHFMF